MIRKGITIMLLIIVAGVMGTRVYAQSELRIGEAVDGNIANPGDREQWTFFALQNDIFSFRVEADDNFDPILTILDPNGDAIIVTDDYNYPDSRDALAEAITMPRTGTYTVIVTGYAGTTGTFTLTVLPGYADLAFTADFGAIGDWAQTGELIVDASAEQVFLELTGIQERGALVQPEAGPFADFFMEMNVDTVGGRNGWTVGAVLRWQSNGNHTVVEVRSQGSWRLVRVEGDQVRVIRDWTTHPAIQAGQTTFRLGVLAVGDGFEVFYNGQFVGQVVDAGPQSGQIGVSLLTADAFGSSTSITVDSLLITTPLEGDGVAVFPDQLVVGNATQTMRELERRRLIPMGGSQALNVSESFLERRSDGVDTLPLGRGTTFEAFAMSTTINLELQDMGVAACGLMLRNVGENAYTVAFVDNFGGYGISERQGEVFTNGFYDENPAWIGETGHNLLVVVADDRMDYFVNGRYLGRADISTVEGQVGNAILNYDPLTSICRFEDTWLWRWE